MKNASFYSHNLAKYKYLGVIGANSWRRAIWETEIYSYLCGDDLLLGKLRFQWTGKYIQQANVSIFPATKFLCDVWSYSNYCGNSGG